MKDPRARMFLLAGLLAALAAIAMALAAADSHLHLSFIGGNFNFDFKLGATASPAASILGTVALGSFLAALGLHLSNPQTDGKTAVGWYGFSEITALLRRLTKSKQDSWLGGVCGGLGEHTPLPAWVWRVAFLLILFCYGFGLLLYAALWICLPEPRLMANQPEVTPGSATSAAH